eukprot:1339514-Prymnesium_polylepis.1
MRRGPAAHCGRRLVRAGVCARVLGRPGGPPPARRTCTRQRPSAGRAAQTRRCSRRPTPDARARRGGAPPIMSRRVRAE